MVSWSWTVPLCSALVLAGCAAHAGLPSYADVPDFTLTDQSGAPFNSSNALHGQVWVADFIFTTCSGPCPRMSSQMHQVQTALSGSDGFRLVSFTVDPAHDTPEVLAAYGRNFQAQTGRWFFLTGSQAALQHLSRDVFLLGDVDARLEHSTRFVLIDRNSHVRGFYDTSDQDAVPHLIADAKSLLQERSSVDAPQRDAPQRAAPQRAAPQRAAPQRKVLAAIFPNWRGGHALLWR